jgi:hypothetical protein
MSNITWCEPLQFFYHSWRFKVTRNTTHVRKLHHLAGKNEKAASIGGFFISGGLGYHL